MRYLRIAVTCYLLGWGIGSVAAWAAWATASHEHRYRLNRSTL